VQTRGSQHKSIDLILKVANRRNLYSLNFLAASTHAATGDSVKRSQLCGRMPTVVSLRSIRLPVWVRFDELRGWASMPSPTDTSKIELRSYPGFDWTIVIIYLNIVNLKNQTKTAKSE
jgi:hypothetical protein